MPRNDKTAVAENPDVETTVEGEDVVVDGPEASADAPKAAAKKEPARGDLPEDIVTPVGLAKLLSKPIDGNAENTDASNFYHTDKNGGHEVKPQMVYSYMKNASKEDPFPVITTEDSIGKQRQTVKVSEGLAWWSRKNERAAARKASAAEKAEKSAAAKAKKEAEAANTTEAEAGEPEATEAE
jgi:hypothetical protein